LGGVATLSHVDKLDHGVAARFRRVMGTRKAVALSCALLGAGAGFGAGFLVGQKSSRGEVAVPNAAVNVRETASSAAPVAALAQPEVNARVDELALVERRLMPAASTVHRQPIANGVGLEVADPIAEELALLRRAERAIRSKNALLAHGLLRELEQRFPKGKLIEERTAARVMANCQQLEPEAARRAGEAYLKQANSGVYRERVRQLCGLTEVAPNGKSEGAEKASVPSGD
jgi:hypothetical protein